MCFVQVSQVWLFPLFSREEKLPCLILHIWVYVHVDIRASIYMFTESTLEFSHLENIVFHCCFVLVMWKL